MACTPCTLRWFLGWFVFIRGLHSLYIAPIITVFCIYPWPVFIRGLHSLYTALIPTVFCIYPWPAQDERWSQVPELSVQRQGQWKTLLPATSETEREKDQASNSWPDSATTLYSLLLIPTAHCCCCSLLYSTILHSRADSLRLHVVFTWVTSFLQYIFFYIHRSGVLMVLAWLVPRETAAV